MKKPCLAILTTWVKEAWNYLTNTMVNKSFLKSGISNYQDDTEDNQLWNDDQVEELQGDNET